MAGCIAGCQYIPSIEYFAHWLHHGTIHLEAHEHFQKRSWRNKTAILGCDIPLLLSVPLKKGKHHQKPILDVEISYDECWPRIHQNSIKTAYGKTAFFAEMESDLNHILQSGHLRLWDLNLALLNFITTLIPGNLAFEITSEYETRLPESVVDLRDGIVAGATSISLDNIQVYQQVLRMHKTHFPNLSILDLLCHLGPGTKEYLVRYASQLYP